MPYGERRPGPGAPKGNTNALKSGRYSARLRAVMAALSQNPELCDYFTSVRSRQLRNQRRAAGEMHTALLEVIQRAPTRSNPRSSPICGRHPLGQPARQGTRTEVNQRRTIQQLRQGRPPRKQ